MAPKATNGIGRILACGSCDSAVTHLYRCAGPHCLLTICAACRRDGVCPECRREILRERRVSELGSAELVEIALSGWSGATVGEIRLPVIGEELRR